MLYNATCNHLVQLGAYKPLYIIYTMLYNATCNHLVQLYAYIQAFTYYIYIVIQAFFNSHTSLVHKTYNDTELHRHSNPHHSIFTLLSLLTIKAIHHTALACANIIQYSLCLAQPIPLPPSSELSSTLLQFKLPQTTTNKVVRRSKPIHVAEMK